MIDEGVLGRRSGHKIDTSSPYLFSLSWVIGPWFCRVCFWWHTVQKFFPLNDMFLGVQLKAEWVTGTGCIITETNNKILIAIFIYSMCFDLIVLLLNTYKLIQLNAHAPVSEMFGQSRLTHMMWSDGLIYFFIAYVSQFPLQCVYHWWFYN